MEKYAIAVLVSVLLSLISPGYARASNGDLEKIRAAATKKFPGSLVVSVKSTPIIGIFEVILSPQKIIYTDSTVNYVLTGELIDVEKRVSLTEQRLAYLNRVNFSNLPLQQAIKTVHGNGKRKLAVFSDPDCPYCRRLERETLSKLDNVTIYTFLFPLDQHTDASRKSKVIWCSQDRSKAWQEWMLNDSLPLTVSECATPMSANAGLGEALGVRATPTLVLEQGDLISGLIGLEKLKEKLN